MPWHNFHLPLSHFPCRQKHGGMQGVDPEEIWGWWGLPDQGFMGTEGQEEAVR